jgi:hypothetical protein
LTSKAYSDNIPSMSKEIFDSGIKKTWLEVHKKKIIYPAVIVATLGFISMFSGTFVVAANAYSHLSNPIQDEIATDMAVAGEGAMALGLAIIIPTDIIASRKKNNQTKKS